jgi:hypothetical protein
MSLHRMCYFLQVYISPCQNSTFQVAVLSPKPFPRTELSDITAKFILLTKLSGQFAWNLNNLSLWRLLIFWYTTICNKSLAWHSVWESCLFVVTGTRVRRGAGDRARDYPIGRQSTRNGSEDTCPMHPKSLSHLQSTTSGTIIVGKESEI